MDILSYAPGCRMPSFVFTADDEFIAELAAHVLSFARELEEKSSEFAEKGWIKPPQRRKRRRTRFLRKPILIGQ